MSDYLCLWAGLGSAAVSAIFYAVYKNREGTIRSLQVQLNLNSDSQCMQLNSSVNLLDLLSTYTLDFISFCTGFCRSALAKVCLNTYAFTTWWLHPFQFFSTRSQLLYSASWRDQATWFNKAQFESTNGKISVQPHKCMQQFQTIPHNKGNLQYQGGGKNSPDKVIDRTFRELNLIRIKANPYYLD